MMPGRIMRAAVAVLLAIFALGPMAGADSATLTVLNIATVGNENDALAFYARDAGFFQKNGIDAHIEILRAASGAGIAAAVVGGAADIGESDIVSLAAAHEHGVPLVALAPSFKVRNTDLTTFLVVAKDSPIKSARDLAEKVVAVPSLTGPLKLATVAWLQKRRRRHRRVAIRRDAANQHGPGARSRHDRRSGHDGTQLYRVHQRRYGDRARV